MINILVSGASGIVGYGILRSLRKADLNLSLTGTTIYEDSVAEGFCDNFEKALATHDPSYLDWLASVIKKNSIDFLIPGIDLDLYKWSENKDQIEKTGAKVLCNNSELINLCKDKWLFYQKLSELNSQYTIPSTLDNDFDTLVGEFGLPFLLKPKHGFGSKGIVIVTDEKVFSNHKQYINSILMVQPIVGNDEEEFTTSAFCDGKGSFYTKMTLRRKLSKDGYTDRAETCDLNGIDEALNELCTVFKPIGPTNFQFRLHKGNLKLLEINPRISSSTSIRTAFGYNEAAMSVNYFMFNKIPSQPEILKGRAVRYAEDFIFYENRSNI